MVCIRSIMHCTRLVKVICCSTSKVWFSFNGCYASSDAWLIFSSRPAGTTVISVIFDRHFSF
jgi:hypothetical protein